MAETYRNHVLTEAFKDQVAVYDRGSFLGHFPSFETARAHVDARREAKSKIREIGRTAQ